MDDSAVVDGRACYTTARVQGDRVRHLAEHHERLERDAALLGLPHPDRDAVRAAFQGLGRALFARAAGAVRLQLSSDPRGSLRLIGIPRELGPDPAVWRAARAPFPHPGPGPYPGVKLADRALFTGALASAREAGADEALLFDADGFLVEGSRSCPVALLPSGELVTPPLARGGVRSVAGAALRRLLPELREADLGADALGSARELVAINAIRGARALVTLDDRPIGDGRPGAAAARIAALLAGDVP